MADLIKIAVDAMGGDNSPKKVIDGIIYNHKKLISHLFGFVKIFDMALMQWVKIS